MKRVVKALSFILIAIVLTGCAEQNIHMDITNSKVKIAVTDAMNKSIRTEEEVTTMISEYKAKGYDVEKYVDEEDDMIGIVYSKTYKLSEVSGTTPVVYHLEEGMRNNFTNPRIFQVEKGTFGNKYTAQLVLDTSVFLDLDEGETQEEYESEINEYASYVDLSYTVTLPSKAKSHNADSVDGKTYTWNVEYGEKIEINYEFTTIAPIVFITIGLVVIAIILVVTYFIVKKVQENKKNNPSSSEELSNMDETNEDIKKKEKVEQK